MNHLPGEVYQAILPGAHIPLTEVTRFLLNTQIIRMTQIQPLTLHLSS